jgi:ribosomal protein S18 acetylase RimI-like enzyme
MNKNTIVKSNEQDYKEFAGIASQSFIESHGRSAAPEDINKYVLENYNWDVCKAELADAKNNYHFIYHDNILAGFSKIVFNVPHPNIAAVNVTKLERFYLLKEFYGMRIGDELFNYNIELSKANHQSGMWLYVWKENLRAIRFYKKKGFEMIGSHEFKLTEKHCNQDHQLFLKY